jgi:hypothetical protein
LFRNKKKEHTCSYDEPPQKRGPKRQNADGDETAKSDKQPRKRRKKSEAKVDSPQQSPLNTPPPPLMDERQWGQRKQDVFQNSGVFQIQHFNKPNSQPQQSSMQHIPFFNERPPMPSGLLNQNMNQHYNGHFVNDQFNVPQRKNPSTPPVPRELSVTPTTPSQQSSSSIANLPFQSSVQQYFQQMFLNLAFMERHKAAAIISYINDLQNGTQTTSVVPSNDELALIFSLQAWFFRRFLIQSVSIRCTEKARELIAKDFDGILANTNIAATFCYTGLYMMEENEFDRAFFYFNNVASYLRKSVERPKNENPLEANMVSYRHKVMRMVLFQAMYCIRDQKNLSQLAKSQMLIFYYGKQCRKITNMLESDGQSAINNNSTAEELEFGKYLEIMQDDVDNNTDNFRLNASVMDRLCSKFIELFTKGEPGIDSDMKNMAILFVAQGVKLQCLQREGRSTDPETRRSADQVSTMTTTVPFNYAHHSCIQPVALAMGSHMRFLEATSDAREKAILIDLLKTDLRALALLGEKFKFVSSRYAGLIGRVETTVKQHEEQQQLQQLYASMRTYSDVLGEAHSACANQNSPAASPIILPSKPSSVPPSPMDESSKDSMLDLLYGTDDGLQRSNSMPLFDVGDEFLEDFFGSEKDSPGTKTVSASDTFFL